MNLDCCRYPHNFCLLQPFSSGRQSVRSAYAHGRCAHSLLIRLLFWSNSFRRRHTCSQGSQRHLTTTPLRGVCGDRPRALLQLQLLYLRHMCVFHHGGNLLKGTPGQLSVKLDIPEFVLRHLLEVGRAVVRTVSKLFLGSYFAARRVAWYICTKACGLASYVNPQFLSQRRAQCLFTTKCNACQRRYNFHLFCMFVSPSLPPDPVKAFLLLYIHTYICACLKSSDREL